MTFVIWLLTAVLVLDCLLLVLLVLIQLPKKDAGAGIAFGGAATDALFGAGSGNVLTKITKWIAAMFFILAVVLGMFKNREVHPRSRLVLPTEVESRTPAPSTMPAATPTAPPVNPIVSDTQGSGQNLSGLLSTNVSSLLSTNISTNISSPPK